MGCFPYKKTKTLIIQVSKEQYNSINIKLQRKMLVQGYEKDPFEKYHKVDELGKGSYGKVLKVLDITNNKYRAMKIINKVNSKKYDENKILKEINILSLVDHPNIIKVLEFYKTSSSFYIITELLNGGELFNKISNSKYLEESKACHVMRQIFSAVNYCHKNNIFHRDLKPENILIEECLDNMYNIKIIDFGTSEIFKKDKVFHRQIGTSYYIAPEVLKNKYNHKCDLWSCGVIMYILLSGSPPFYGVNEQEILKSVQTGKFEFRSKIWNKISYSAKDLLCKLLEVNIEKRYSAEQALNHRWMSNFDDSFETQNDSVTKIDPPKINLNKVVDNIKNFGNFKDLQKTCIYFLIHHFTNFNDIREFKKIFLKFDKNSDGKLTKEEIVKGFRDCKFINISEEQIYNLISNIDIDQNGYIEYQEFLTATFEAKNLITEENLKNVFELFDKDSSGKISSEELRLVLDLQLKDKQVVNTLINDTDLDGDGEISFDEFKTMMLNLNK